MVCGLPKYAGDVARSRGSSPKLQVLNTALMTVTSGITLTEARADREFWGATGGVGRRCASHQCRHARRMHGAVLA